MARKKRPEGTRRPNGASSIYLGSDGKWHGWVTVGVRDDIKPDRRHVKRTDEGDVIEAVRNLENQRDAGKVRKPGRAREMAYALGRKHRSTFGPQEHARDTGPPCTAT